MRRLLKSFLVTLLFACFAIAEQPAPARITGPINEHQLVALQGNRHPLARAEFDRGPAPDDLPMHRMLLLLSRASEQQAALDKLVEQQHTPGSSQYRQWLTPADFARRFGPADADVQAVSQWLRQQGFSVTRVANGKTVIEFDGSAAQVRNAFHTQMHRYTVRGRDYWANAQDPQIPATLKPVVRGIVSLNNFPIRTQTHELGVFTRNADGTVVPAYTVNSGGSNYYALGPADFATIYNTQPLLQAGNNGAGQTIAVIGVSNVNLKDITDFRNLFGLGAGNTSVVLDGPDPGIVPGAEGESVLDLEWANGVAPGASVVLVSAEDTETTSGLELAALYAIENNLAGVISFSYGACEAELGNSGNQYFQSLWEQAAAQGTTVVVSAGDNGSAGCDDQNAEQVAASGLAISGAASTPFNVAVGGTDFDDVGTQPTYWNPTNTTTTLASAKSYIPETTWNQSCAAVASSGNLNTACPALPSSGTPPASLQLWSGSGGASSCSTSSSSGGTIVCQSGTAKPAWQSGNGVPADGVRDIPDVSLFAAFGSASNSFYTLCEADALPSYYGSCQPSTGGIGTYFVGAGGTSASAPSFAAIVALAEQKIGSRLGNLNYLLYSLAAGAGASCSSNASGANCIFHDVVLGNNSVPCKAGSPNCSLSSGSGTGVMVDSSQAPAYAASAGYDLTTGLGSVNAANLVAAIATAASGFSPTSTTLMLNGSTAGITAQHGSAINVAVNVSPSASTGEVSLFGNSGSIDFNTLTAGSASWNSKLFPGGSYTVKAHYPGDGTHGASDSNSVPVTISPEASQTFVNFFTFGPTGAPQAPTAGSVSYGSPYVLRMDVTDAGGSVSASQGASSKCSTGAASCPTGTMTLTANGSALDGGSFKLNSKGFAEDQLIQLPAGSYTVAASYPGDLSYTASSGSASVTITKAVTTLTANTPVLPPFPYGEQFQVGAQLTTTSSGVTPTGTISFVDNGSPAAYVSSISQNGGPGGSSGYAHLSYSAEYAPASLGTHTVSAQYSGDANYSGSASNSFTINVVKANTSVSTYGVTPRTATPNLAVNVSATISSNSVASPPTGTVTFSDNGNPISGTVTYTPQPGSFVRVTAQMSVIFALGNHHITMSYSGDSYYNPVTQDMGTLVVDNQIPTTIAVNPIVDLPANSRLYIQAYIATGNYGGPAMTGTVSFQDGNDPISGTVTYNPTPQYGSMFATVFYAFPTPGIHTVNYQYSGDSNYAPSSGSVAVNVLGPLGLSFPGNTGGATPNYLASVATGTAAVAIFIDNETTSAMSVMLSCAPVSGGATCSPSPASLTVNSYTSPQVMLNVTAPKTSATLRHRYPMTVPFVFAGILVGFAGTRCKKHRVLLVIMTLATLLPLAACGGGSGGSGSGGLNGGGSSGGGSGGTSVVAAGAYSFTVTATSGANTASRNFTVTFQ